MSGHPDLAIVGATGAVGREFVTILAERGTPAESLRLLASARSAGSEIEYRGSRLTVNELTTESFAGVDIALFSAGAATAEEYAPAAVDAGATVIDNSSAFRMDADVPLVVPEINGQRAAGAAIIANPNCSTIILLTALDPLYRHFGIERLVVSTYQAASGAGAAAMRELAEQSGAVLAGTAAEPHVFAEPCAFNVFSHDTAVDPATGRNVEEQKVIDEARKIWDEPDLPISVTCIRVPVMRAHAESVNVSLRTPATEAAVREALATADGIEIVDDREANDFPTSLKASGRDDILVGRIRPDESQGKDSGNEGASGADQPRSGDVESDLPAWLGFELFIAGDQLRKGAALNAIQIADTVGLRRS